MSSSIWHLYYDFDSNTKKKLWVVESCSPLSYLVRVQVTGRQVQGITRVPEVVSWYRSIFTWFLLGIFDSFRLDKTNADRCWITLKLYESLIIHQLSLSSSLQKGRHVQESSYVPQSNSISRESLGCCRDNRHPGSHVPRTEVYMRRGNTVLHATLDNRKITLQGWETSSYSVNITRAHFGLHH